MPSSCLLSIFSQNSKFSIGFAIKKNSAFNARHGADLNECWRCWPPAAPAPPGCRCSPRGCSRPWRRSRGPGCTAPAPPAPSCRPRASRARIPLKIFKFNLSSGRHYLQSVVLSAQAWGWPSEDNIRLIKPKFSQSYAQNRTWECATRKLPSFYCSFFNSICLTISVLPPCVNIIYVKYSQI